MALAENEEKLTEAMEVWFATMSPLTRFDCWVYGLPLVRATCIDAGPHGMKEANCLSLILKRDLCTW